MNVIFDKIFLGKGESNKFKINRVRFTKISNRNKLDINDFDRTEFILTHVCYFPFIYSFKHKLWIIK